MGLSFDGIFFSLYQRAESAYCGLIYRNWFYFDLWIILISSPTLVLLSLSYGRDLNEIEVGTLKLSFCKDEVWTSDNEFNIEKLIHILCTKTGTMKLWNRSEHGLVFLRFSNKRNLGSISSTFHVQLLCPQIPKV